MFPNKTKIETQPWPIVILLRKIFKMGQKIIIRSSAKFSRGESFKAYSLSIWMVLFKMELQYTLYIITTEFN